MNTPAKKPTGLLLAQQGIEFVERKVATHSPILANLLVMGIGIFAVIGVLAALYVPVRSLFFEVLFVLVFVLALAVIAVLLKQAYRGQTVGRARRTLVLLFLIVVIVGAIWGDTTLFGIKRSASFMTNYILLYTRGDRASLTEFVKTISSDGDTSEINSSEQVLRFVRTIPQSGNSLELVGMNDNRIVSNQRFLWELTRNDQLSISGKIRVEAPAKAAVVLAARKIQLTATDLYIGEHDLILLTEEFEANGASIRAFQREARFHIFEQDGKGSLGKNAGTVYLILLQPPKSLQLAIDIAGEPGGPGAAGENGGNGRTPPTEKVRDVVPGRASGRILEILGDNVTSLAPKSPLDPRRIDEIRHRPEWSRCVGKSCIVYFCETPAGEGDAGAEGENGTSGLPGGAAGLGGAARVIAFEKSKEIADQINFNRQQARGGKGGAAGMGGQGGRGGRGQAPDDFRACAPAADGRFGPQGVNGREGAPGADGSVPRLNHDVLSMQIGTGRL